MADRVRPGILEQRGIQVQQARRERLELQGFRELQEHQHNRLRLQPRPPVMILWGVLRTNKHAYSHRVAM